jgi:Transcriptional regulator
MRVPDIDLDLVRCFVTVVESDGFTQASKRLHLTQSATTMKIKRLEELLGQRLFVKTVPPLELTLEGEIVLGYAFRLLELNRDMVMRVSKPDAMTTIRLGSFPTSVITTCRCGCPPSKKPVRRSEW